MIVGSRLALVVRLVVVVVVVVDGVVVQPTIPTIQTPKTSGISFFISTGLSARRADVTPSRLRENYLAGTTPHIGSFMTLSIG